MSKNDIQKKEIYLDGSLTREYCSLPVQGNVLFTICGPSNLVYQEQGLSILPSGYSCLTWSTSRRKGPTLEDICTIGAILSKAKAVVSMEGSKPRNSQDSRVILSACCLILYLGPVLRRQSRSIKSYSFILFCFAH
jgi:hypothetical protein